MPIMNRLDPELAEVVNQLPVLYLTDIPAARAALAQIYAQIKPEGPNPAVSSADHLAPGTPGNPDVMVRVSGPPGRLACCRAWSGSRAAVTC